MKTFFGGSAVLASALLTASILFNARPLTAETNPNQGPIQQIESPLAKDCQITSHLPTSTDMPELSAPPELPNPTLSRVRVNLADSPPANTLDSNGYSLASLVYKATAYSLTGRTASGVRPVKGMIAADPSVLPLGTRVRLDAGNYSGDYTVTDSGAYVRGRRIDVWVPNTREALRFGRRNVKLTVLHYGRRRRG